MSVVLKVKQIQNLKFDQNACEKWQSIREEEINNQMEVLENQDQMEGMDDPMYLERQRENLMNEEDWRGYKMV